MYTLRYFKHIAMTIAVTLLFVGLLMAYPLQSQGTLPFLSPPYFGQANVSAIFDHEFPVYCGFYPTPPPIPTPPATPNPADCKELKYAPLSTPPIPTQYEVAHTMIHNDGQRVWQDANPDLGYSGHSGVDYTFGYDYILATHSGVVMEAGWDNPDDSSDGYGLHVRLRATDGIHTSIYGHLNTLMIKEAQLVTTGIVLGISGATGNVFGNPGTHLHLSIERLGEDLNPANKGRFEVNPYGWQAASADPWDFQFNVPSSVLLWLNYPAIGNTNVYPAGTALEWPTGSPDTRLIPNIYHPNTYIVDNLTTSGEFSVSGDWNVGLCPPANCIGNSFHLTNESDTKAVWQPLPGRLTASNYDVYVYIPGGFSENYAFHVVYEINDGNILETAEVQLSQSRFRYRDTLRWVYLGRYMMDGDGEDYVKLVREQGDYALADAVAFIPADEPDLNLMITANENDAGPEGMNSSCNDTTSLTRPEIYLGHCNNGLPITSGFRFENVPLPKDAVILAAHLEFRIDGVFSRDLTLRVYGENSTSPSPFSLDDQPSARPLTSNYTHWAIPTSDLWQNPAGLPYGRRYSPDIKDIIQEIVAMNTWEPDQSDIVLLVRPQPYASTSGGTTPFYRRVMAYERDTPPHIPPSPPGLYSARLLIWYEECQSPPNCLVEP